MVGPRTDQAALAIAWCASVSRDVAPKLQASADSGGKR
jgi:hypothetical protein